MVFANLLAAAIMVLFGSAVKYGKLYDLIAGYNTLPPEEKAKVDEERLGNFIGSSLIYLAVVLVIGGVLDYFGVRYAGPASWIIFTIYIIYVAIRAQGFKKQP